MGLPHASHLRPMELGACVGAAGAVTADKVSVGDCVPLNPFDTDLVGVGVTRQLLPTPNVSF